MRAIELFEINFKRASDLLIHHRTTHARGRPVTGGVDDEILRSAVVFAVASLDAYLGMRIYQVVERIIFLNKKIPDPALDYIEGGLAEKNRTRFFLNQIALAKDPRKIIIQRLKEGLSKETFQKPTHVEKALKIMEVPDPWTELDRCLAPTRGRRGRPYSCQKFLSDLSSRRDDIVHNGDVYVSHRHHGKLKPIGRSMVDEWLRKLRKVVLTIEKMTQKPV